MWLVGTVWRGDWLNDYQTHAICFIYDVRLNITKKYEIADMYHGDLLLFILQDKLIGF